MPPRGGRRPPVSECGAGGLFAADPMTTATDSPAEAPRGADSPAGSSVDPSESDVAGTSGGGADFTGTSDAGAEDADATSTEPDSAEDRRAQRRGLAAMWAGPGGAVAAMVAVSWYVVVRNGGQPPGGDMVGHAAAAEWFRTQPWWDWRGWSDWFYGGQAMGVNYPPLGHVWMRFTHPVYGQMAAVTVGLLVLLPWGALRLARAVGYPPAAQRAAVGAVFALTALSGGMHWFLPGLHQYYTFFGSWTAIPAISLSLFCAAWAARCLRPVACGAVAGMALLWNPNVVPGAAVLCLALLISSGASFRQGVRWAVTACSAALAACAWWLVPFMASWGRLVRFEAPLAASWGFGEPWKVAVVIVLGVTAAWSARCGLPAKLAACEHAGNPPRRLALAGAAVLAAVLAADLFGYLRPERWLASAMMAAAMAAAPLLVRNPTSRPLRRGRPVWALIAVAFSLILVVVTGRLELSPAVVWLLLWPSRLWARFGAVAWVGVLLFVPLWDPLPAVGEVRPASDSSPMQTVAAEAGRDDGGSVYLDPLYNTPAGDVVACGWGDPWRTTEATGGRLRPLFGLHRETNHSAEFIGAELSLRTGRWASSRPERPHWAEEWEEAGGPRTATPAAAVALGARWYAACNADGEVELTELGGTLASGVSVDPHADEDDWHRAAVNWWIRGAAVPAAGELVEVPRDSDASQVPILLGGDGGAYPARQAASGVALQGEGDVLTVRADTAGWAWLRVPWDPWWHSDAGLPVYKGGPGHLVVWVPEGESTLRWAVPVAVDAAAAGVTGGGVLGAVALASLNRRRGFPLDTHRPRPAAQAVALFADTVDGWAHKAADRAKRTARSLTAGDAGVVA